MNIDPGLGENGRSPQPYRGRGRFRARAPRGKRGASRGDVMAMDGDGRSQRRRGASRGGRSFSQRGGMRDEPYSTRHGGRSRGLAMDDEMGTYVPPHGRSRGGRGEHNPSVRGGKDGSSGLRPLNLESAVGRTLVAFAKLRYNATSKFMDYARLAEADELASLRMDLNVKVHAHNILSVVAQLYPEAETLCFDNNRIRTLSGFSGLAKMLPNIVNVSFKENQIRDLEQLMYLRGARLKEVVFFGNPFLESNTKEAYHSAVCSRFPSIRFIDGEEPKGQIKFDIPDYVRSVVLPMSVPSFFDSPATQQIATSFVRRFCTCFDSSRPSLVFAYVEGSVFSCITPSSGQARSPFIRYSRNLLKITDSSKRNELLAQGPSSIVATISSLPPTRHTLDNLAPEEAERSSVDAFVFTCGQTQMLQICVRGTVQVSVADQAMFGPGAQGTVHAYLFWHVFLCSPRPGVDSSRMVEILQATSPESMDGWPLIISNEQLCVSKIAG